jgi:uncharacterized protein
MSSRDFDPYRLDVAVFAKESASLEGRSPLRRFERLAELVVAASAPDQGAEVAWRAAGESLATRGGEAQVWLHLRASTVVPLECQRCLKPVDVPIGVYCRFLFVPGEDAAAQLDADSDDDVLALNRALNLHELIEDELLLALPLVPRHEICPEPLRMPAGDEAIADDKPNPFAALAALKRFGSPN